MDGDLNQVLKRAFAALLPAVKAVNESARTACDGIAARRRQLADIDRRWQLHSERMAITLREGFAAVPKDRDGED